MTKPNAFPGKSDGWIIQPSRFDVLCGRGRKIQSHEGNRRLRYIVNLYREHYNSSGTKADKTRLSQLVVESIQEYGGRFLRYDSASNAYTQVDKTIARNKVSHALRVQLGGVSNRHDWPVDSTLAGDRIACTPPMRLGSDSVPPCFQSLLTSQQNIFRELLMNDNFEDDEQAAIVSPDHHPIY